MFEQRPGAATSWECSWLPPPSTRGPSSLSTSWWSCLQPHSTDLGARRGPEDPVARWGPSDPAAQPDPVRPAVLTVPVVLTVPAGLTVPADRRVPAGRPVPAC